MKQETSNSKSLGIIDNQDGTVDVLKITNFNLEKTLTSGQCFRFSQAGRIWTVQSEDKVVKIIQDFENNKLLFMGETQEIKDYWIQYLGLTDDYSEIHELIKDNEFLVKAEQYSQGLKILHQDPWETLVCFIISQRNNIPKIKTTVERICRACGKPISAKNTNTQETYYTFPTPEELLRGLSENGNNLGLGYRLPYLEAAAKAVLNGTLNLSELTAGNSTYYNAIQRLQSLYGVGPKVANCVALFGLGHTSAFPVDIWVQRVIDREFNGIIDINKFGEYAGIIQQYMFYYGRNKGE